MAPVFKWQKYTKMPVITVCGRAFQVVIIKIITEVVDLRRISKPDVSNKVYGWSTEIIVPGLNRY